MGESAINFPPFQHPNIQSSSLPRRSPTDEDGSSNLSPFSFVPCPMPPCPCARLPALCPMPHALCPMLFALCPWPPFPLPTARSYHIFHSDFASSELVEGRIFSRGIVPPYRTTTGPNSEFYRRSFSRPLPPRRVSTSISMSRSRSKASSRWE
jgi:hypothetical protein